VRTPGLGALSPGPKGVGGAFAVSLAVHGLALAAIVLGLGTSSVPDGVPVMDVEVVMAMPGEPGRGGDPAPVAPTPSAPAAAVAPPPSAPAEATPTGASDATRDTPADITSADIAVRLPPPEPPPPVRPDELRERPLPVSPTPAAAPPRAAPPPASNGPRQAASPARTPSQRPSPPAPSPAVSSPAPAPGNGSSGDTAASRSGGGGARLVRHVPPVYPAPARQRGIEGRVVVRLVVGADGVPAEVRVAQGSGSDLLDAAAVDAVRQWRFEPARRAGVAVPEERLAPVVFRLRR
jgi:protein TonB